MSTGVVIPFFQRTPGILRRALTSVVAQEGNEPIDVVVVDDSSPISATDETSSLATHPRVRISVLRQANAGPAAARNRALDELSSRVDRIAFLDSDDRWSSGHLERARRALAAGHDFYFSDHYQLGQSVSAFDRAARIDITGHPSLPGEPRVHAWHGDMVDQVIRGNVIGTSTVVYSITKLGTVRFDEDFFSAGEDYLFWIACASAGARFCFSTEAEVAYGEGVNIYSRSGWGTPGFFKRVQSEMRYRKKLLTLPLAPSQRSYVQSEVRRLRKEIASDLLHRLLHRLPLSRHDLERQIRLDPQMLVYLPIHMGSIAARRLRGTEGQ